MCQTQPNATQPNPTHPNRVHPKQRRRRDAQNGPQVVKDKHRLLSGMYMHGAYLYIRISHLASLSARFHPHNQTESFKSDRVSIHHQART